MALPDRDSLLDLDWLTRTQAAETGPRLRDLVRDAADVYGGTVTAIAEALHDLSWPAGNLLQWIDLRHGLAHALASGSWSSAPTGDHTFYSCSQWLFRAFRITRPEMFRQNPARFEITCVSPPLPDLGTLRLAPPLDRAWVTPHYGVFGCAVSPDHRYVISGSRASGSRGGGHLIVWDGEHGTRTADVVDPYEVRDCAVASDGRHLISQNSRGRVAVWTLPALTLVGTIEEPRGEPAFEWHPSRESRHVGGSPRRWRRFAVSADAGRLAVAGFDTVRIYTLAPLEMIASVDGLSHLPHGILALGFVGVDRLVIVGRNTPMPVWE
jgi:WD40 repeat protein